MTNPAFNLAAGLVARAEGNMPQPSIAGQKLPIMDDEDALADEIDSLRQVADRAIDRTARFRMAIVHALLFLARREPDQARTILENALDAELQPKPDTSPVPF